MNPMRVLGGFALAIGGGMLGGEALLGREQFAELTGGSLSFLWPMCIVTIILGSLAVALGRREEHESDHHTGRADQ